MRPGHQHLIDVAIVVIFIVAVFQLRTEEEEEADGEVNDVNVGLGKK